MDRVDHSNLDGFQWKAEAFHGIFDLSQRRPNCSTSGNDGIRASFSLAIRIRGGLLHRSCCIPVRNSCADLSDDIVALRVRQRTLKDHLWTHRCVLLAPGTLNQTNRQSNHQIEYYGILSSKPRRPMKLTWVQTRAHGGQAI